MRLALLAGLILSACGPAPAPPHAAAQDETKAAWYNQLVEKLAAQNRETERLLKTGKPDAAADLIQKGQPMATRLLAVPRPTLAAMVDASDLDDLYGHMLLSNRNYGWARLFFQKNLARWKNWPVPTADTAARLKAAQAAIDETDRRMLAP